MGNASESSISSPEGSYAYHQATSSQQPPRPPISKASSGGGGASRADRPCDACRRRKSRCSVEPGQPRCVLCTFHHRECTFLDEPARRKRKRVECDARPDAQSRGITNGSGHSAGDERGGDRSFNPGPPTVSGDHGRHSHSDEPATVISAPTTTVSGAGSMSTTRSLLDRTLGLHRTTHSKHVGASSLHDLRLIDLVPAVSRPARFRRVDSSTVFVGRPDAQTLFSADDEDDLEAIEQIVRPHGPALVNLYFRIVHPSYPILHKGVFLEKYARGHTEFSPPLLASVYVLAMDWWEYDRELVPVGDPPDAERLIKAATKTLTSVVHRPKLSTLQAGLLLLQRSGGDSWVLTSQVVAVAEELGLHLDCSAWNIPDWEKGLRRRLAWAVYMQDKWGALIHGRPSHIRRSGWRARRLRLDDFPESAADEDDEEGSTEVDKGRHLFMQLAVLTEIMAEALELLYPVDQTWNSRGGVHGVLEVVKPIAIRLRDWAAGLPPGLRMEDVKSRKLCSNGYLHLSYFATEIVIHRCIVRATALPPAAAPDSNLAGNNTDASPTPATTPPSPGLRDLCRTAARARLDRAVAFAETLRPEHLQGFWWFASPKSLALIGVYGALLWATSATEAEADACRRRLDDFRWSLKVRARGSGFLALAIREMDEALEGLDFKQRSPPGPSRREPSFGSTAAVTVASASAPGYPTSLDERTPRTAGGTATPNSQDFFNALPDIGSASPVFGGIAYNTGAVTQSFLDVVDQDMTGLGFAGLLGSHLDPGTMHIGGGSQS